jgi:RNA polymerase sigma-70 factor (ECF subfamily)
VPPDDDGDVSARPDPAIGLLALYDEALPQDYGYLLARCGDRATAEDEREQRGLRLLSTGTAATERDDPWDVELDGPRVAEVAEHLGRTLHATEALLVRARRAFRRPNHRPRHREDT